MQIRTPRLTDSQVGSAETRLPGSCVSVAPPHPRARAPRQHRGEGPEPGCPRVSGSWTPWRAGLSCACPGGGSRAAPGHGLALTWGRAVAALPVPRDASDLRHHGAGQLVPAALPSALRLAEGHVQRLLLAVAEDGHPAAGAESSLGTGAARPCSGCRASRAVGLGDPALPQPAQPHTKVLHQTPVANWDQEPPPRSVSCSRPASPRGATGTPSRWEGHRRRGRGTLAPHRQPEERFLGCSEALTVLTWHSPARPLPGTGTCGCLKHTEPDSSGTPLVRLACRARQDTARLSWAQQSRSGLRPGEAGVTVTSG